VSARQRQRGVQEEWLVKTRIMDEHRAKGRRAWLGISTYQVVPKCRVQRQGCEPETKLPRFVAIWGCRGNGAPLVGAWEGAGQGTADGLPPLPWIGGENSPARREVDGRADDLALEPGRLELPEGKPPIADQRFIGRQLLVDPLKQAEL